MKRIRVIEPPKPTKQDSAISSLYNTQTAISYGEVVSNNEDEGTTNLLLSNGFTVNNINIPSSVYPSKEPLVGGIKYPPIGAQVVIIHPHNDINSGFILPAVLDYRDEDVQSGILGQGDKTLFEAGWIKTFDDETGALTLSNGDNFSLSLDPDGESISFTDFKGNSIVSNSNSLIINGNLEVLQ